MGPSIKYVHKIFRKTNIYNPLIRTRRCVYQVRNVSFSENFAYVLNGWPLWSLRSLILNPFQGTAPILEPLKTPENLLVFWCFQGVWNGNIGQKWVNKSPSRESSKLKYVTYFPFLQRPWNLQLIWSYLTTLPLPYD